VLKAKLELTDDDYRALLQALVMKRSSSDMTEAERQRVREHMQKLAERMGVASPARRAGFQQRYQAASPRERKVWALWGALGRAGLVQRADGQALNAFVYRQVGVSALAFCTAAQLDTLIESLKLWAKRGGEVR